MTENTGEKSTLFNKLDAEDLDNGVTELDSVCMSCFKQGRTKLMLTRIPFYRDIVISSFACEHCNYKNNGVESANRIADKGVNIKLTIKNERDLNRELVKSDFATFKIPMLDFEIPAQTQKGMLTTIEGMLDRVISNLQDDIQLKKEAHPELIVQLSEFVLKLSDLKALRLGEFDIIVDDPSGDSFVENPVAPKKDPSLQVSFYTRSQEQSEMLGLTNDEAVEDKVIASKEEDLQNEVVQFQNNCPNCNEICETNMKLTDIPFFKTVLIMCTTCDKCGVRSSEVKSGTGISEKGIKYTLKLTDPSDINRDLLKSETATLEIPEIDFYMNSGTLGGKFTTIEGILNSCREQLEEVCPFSAGGDSEDKQKANAMRECLNKLEEIQKGKLLNVTIVLDDPSGNSYLQNVYAPEEDPNLKIEHYERDFEQNEILGLNDMKTENYQEEEAK